MDPNSWSKLFRVALTAAAVIVVLAVSRIRRVVVHGWSMSPAFVPGDRLLVVPVRRVQPGDVVAVADPRQPFRLLVKRVESVDPRNRMVTLLGDNRSSSTDSRVFGPVSQQSVVGRAVYRYWPPGRDGRVEGGGSTAAER